jgi:hypothetical protein
MKIIRILAVLSPLMPILFTVEAYARTTTNVQVTDGIFTAAGVAKVGRKVIVAQPILQIGSTSYNINYSDAYKTTDQQEAAMNAICKLFGAGDKMVNYTVTEPGDGSHWTDIAKVDVTGALENISSDYNYIDTVTCTTSAKK